LQPGLLFAGQQETSAAGLSIHNALCAQPDRVAINDLRSIVNWPADGSMPRTFPPRRYARPRRPAAQYRATLMLAIIGMGGHRTVWRTSAQRQFQVSLFAGIDRPIAAGRIGMPSRVKMCLIAG
jgi:hypothetical protein